MPLKTFYKLTEIKKMEIFNTAVEEFSINDYQSASITKVVKKLGISKGGFYRYFKDKKDVYFYLLDTTMNLRDANTGGLTDDPGADFVEWLTSNITGSIRFDLEHPMYSSFLYNALQEKNSRMLGNKYLELKRKLMSPLQKAIIKQIGAGKMRNDVSPEIISFLIVTLQINILEYIAIRFELDIRENIKQKALVKPISDNDINKIVKDFVSLIKNGIGKV